MSLAKFSAEIKYESQGGCEYESSFFQNPKTPNANAVLLATIEHLAWMGGVGFDADEAKQAFERGYEQGKERQEFLKKRKESK